MLATDTDAKLALLASVFEDVPTKELREALEKCNGVVEHAIDLMLSRRGDLPGDDQPKTSEKRLPKRLKEDLQQQRNAFDLLQQPSGPKGRMELFATDIERFLPCRLVEDFLPRDLALSLLDEMLQEASEWKTRKFNLFDRGTLYIVLYG